MLALESYVDVDICCYLSRATRPKVESGDYEAVDVEHMPSTTHTSQEVLLFLTPVLHLDHCTVCGGVRPFSKFLQALLPRIGVLPPLLRLRGCVGSLQMLRQVPLSCVAAFAIELRKHVKLQSECWRIDEPVGREKLFPVWKIGVGEISR